MNRHTIVLAEEKASIQRLVKKAVETKPMGQEKIEVVLPVADNDALFDVLNQTSRAVVLLSTTFSTERSHESLLTEISARYPGVNVISLTHKYGDRSSMHFGAFESVDKPIRNPVLWEILDRAIEASEGGMNEPVKPGKETVKTVVKLEQKPEVKLEKTPEPQPEHPQKTPISPLLVIDDEEDVEDDLFGDSSRPLRKALPVAKTRPVVIADEPEESSNQPAPVPFLLDEEDEELGEPEWTLEPELETEKEPEISAPDTLGHELVIDGVEPVVEFTIPKNKEPEVIPEEPQQVQPEEEEGFTFEVIDDDTEEEPDAELEVPEKIVEPEPAEVIEPSKTDNNDVHEETSLEVEAEEKEDAERVEPAQNTLEPESAISSETPIYNELSEWTLAHEGFTTKNGDFVPLAPPRALLRKSSTASNRVQRTPSAKTATATPADGDKLFGSVRNIFKKK